MSCHGLKCGIGSSSRLFEIDGEKYVLGTLVLSNHGLAEDFMIDCNRMNLQSERGAVDFGSVIVIMATDCPLSYRQIKRVLKRASVGLARTGSFIGNGSGEITIGFSTGNTLSGENGIKEIKVLNEKYMDLLFRAMAESTEESVLNSVAAAKTVTGYMGRTRKAFGEYL